MKKYYLLSTIITCLFLSSCDKVDELTQFTLDYTSSVTIPSTAIANIPINLTTPAIQTESESTFSSKNTSANLIEEINLQTMRLTVVDPTDGDLSFLKDVEVYISADDIGEVKIAWKNDIADNVGNELELETTTEDLKEFIKKDNYQLKVVTTTDKVISEDHKLDIYTAFFVDGKILGI
ncbi:MAG: hypothetical protein GY827_09270 [Cytophagales bacterium]|nr:hypothetical protein [Cytophagales bacterium]